MGDGSADSSSDSFRRDIASAYLASGARIASWVVISALVYRYEGPFDFGLLAVVRGTIGILNYTSLGLAPAMIRFLAGAGTPGATGNRVIPISDRLEYATPSREQIVFSNGVAVALVAACIGLAITLFYSSIFDKITRVPDRLVGDGASLVFLFGMGAVLRLLSDAAGALLQTRGRISLDNQILALTELVWVIGIWIGHGGRDLLQATGFAYAVAGAVQCALRVRVASRLPQTPWPPALV